MDIRDYNRAAWNKQVDKKNRWTVPVSSDEIDRARQGNWGIVLTPTKQVPRAWFGELSGASVMCLAGGGGQQGPILAAAGVRVTVFDNSPAQLEQDRFVAARDGLEIETVEGDMRDLSGFRDESFHLIVHPASNCFVPEINAVWQECYRVLRPGGRLLSGFCNPVLYLFDYEHMKQGRLEVRHQIPYSDLADLSDEELKQLISDDEPLCFGHSLEDQIGGQMRAGFAMWGFFEDVWSDDPDHVSISEYIPAFIATLALKQCDSSQL